MEHTRGAMPAGASTLLLLLALLVVAAPRPADALGKIEHRENMPWVYQVNIDEIRWQEKGWHGPGAKIETVKYFDLVEGEGRPAEHGDEILVMYKLFRKDSKGGLVHVFSQATTKTAYDFILGEKVYSIKQGYSKVTDGFDHALEGMRPGSRRVTIVPPELGYGAKGAKAVQVPPDATLVYFMEMLDVVGPEEQVPLPHADRSRSQATLKDEL